MSKYWIHSKGSNICPQEIWTNHKQWDTNPWDPWKKLTMDGWTSWDIPWQPKDAPKTETLRWENIYQVPESSTKRETHEKQIDKTPPDTPSNKSGSWAYRNHSRYRGKQWNPCPIHWERLPMILCATVATLRNRKGKTMLTWVKWVKGHSGHPRNKGADQMANIGAQKEHPVTVMALG